MQTDSNSGNYQVGGSTASTDVNMEEKRKLEKENEMEIEEEDTPQQ